MTATDLHLFWQRIGEIDMPKPDMKRAMRKAIRARGRELAGQHESESGHSVSRIEPELIYRCRNCEWEAHSTQSKSPA